MNSVPSLYGLLLDRDGRPTTIQAILFYVSVARVLRTHSLSSYQTREARLICRSNDRVAQNAYSTFRGSTPQRLVQRVVMTL